MTRVHVPDDYADRPAAYAWGHYGGVMAEAGFAFSRAVYKNSKLSLREAEGARYRTALINGCATCQAWRGVVDMPVYLAAGGEGDGTCLADNGPAPDEAFYQAVPDWRGSDLFSERERLAIEYAERLGEEPHAIAEDEVFWAKAKARFSDAEIVDLTLSIVSWIAMGRATHVLGFDQTCAIPGRAVATAA